MNPNVLDRANKYLECVDKHCESKKKRFGRRSKKITCGSKELLQECIDKARLNSMNSKKDNVYNVPENIMREGVYVNQQPLGIYHEGTPKNNGTYTSIKPNKVSYVEMEDVRVPNRSPTYMTMIKKKRPPAVLPKGKKTSIKSSPKYAIARNSIPSIPMPKGNIQRIGRAPIPLPRNKSKMKGRLGKTGNKNPFYAPTQKQRRKTRTKSSVRKRTKRNKSFVIKGRVKKLKNEIERRIQNQKGTK